MELVALEHLGLDLGCTGFSEAKLDEALGCLSTFGTTDADNPAEPPAEPRVAVGDIWQLGEHRLICGDSRDSAIFWRLLDGEEANLIFADPPYNLASRVRGRTRSRHGEFAWERESSCALSTSRFLLVPWGMPQPGCATGLSPSSAWTGVICLS